jgi:hypothetical protein
MSVESILRFSASDAANAPRTRVGSFFTRMEKAYPEIDSRSTAIAVEPILAWKVHLLREDPKKVLLIAPVVLASLVVSYFLFHSLLLPAVALLIFASALSEYIFPVRYEITSAGATARTMVGRTAVGWDRVKKYYVDDRGIKLSTLPSSGRLEAYRGVYLRFGGSRDEVIEAVRRMRDATHSSDERK